MADSAQRGPEEVAELMRSYTGAPVEPADMQMVAEGASGRSIMRASHPACAGIIGIYWTPDRADNAAFLPAAHGLRRAGVRVPAVYAERDCGCGCGACLVQDLGHDSLLSLRHAPWHTRRRAYEAALRALSSLHRVRPAWELQPPFDTALYRWEQGYFAEHFLGRHLGLADPAAFLAENAAQEMAEWLASLPRVPVHRDCQSQNIMLWEGEAWFIDFQGMRAGLPEYDLASLVYDPYMDLQPEERAELLDIWSGLAPLRPEILSACALQRIMQALGAFANIGYNKGLTWYLELIPAGGMNSLRQICASAPPDSLASRLASCLSSVIPSL